MAHVVTPSAVAEGSESTDEMVCLSQYAIQAPDEEAAGASWEHVNDTTDTTLEQFCIWEYEGRRGWWRQMSDTLSARLENARKQGKDTVEESNETEHGLYKQVIHIRARKQCRFWWCPELQQWYIVKAMTIRRIKAF